MRKAEHIAILQDHVAHLQRQIDSITRSQATALQLTDFLLPQLPSLLGLQLSGDPMIVGTTKHAIFGDEHAEITVTIDPFTGTLTLATEKMNSLTIKFDRNGRLSDDDQMMVIGYAAKTRNPVAKTQFWSGNATDNTATSQFTTVQESDDIIAAHASQHD